MFIPAKLQLLLLFKFDIVLNDEIISFYWKHLSWISLESCGLFPDCQRKKKWACTIQHCNYSTDRKCDLERHQVTHTKEKLFQCEKCTKYFFTNSDCVRHAKAHDKKPGNKCNFCESLFIRKDNRKKHEIRKHTRNFPHTCSNCQKGFMFPGELRKHKCSKQ